MRPPREPTTGAGTPLDDAASASTSSINRRTSAGPGDGSHWAFEIKGHTTSGKVVSMRARIVKGGSCVAVKGKRTGGAFDFQCLLKRKPRRPFVVAVTYTTALGIERSAGRVAIPVPKQRRR
jgi:hypothetical protein